MLFSLVACSEVSLAKYKTDVKAELDAYAMSLGQSNYTEENWEVVLGLVADGKAAIDAADDKASVDTAKTAAMQTIWEVEMNFIETATEDMIDCSSFQYMASRSSIGYPIILKHQDENVIFECISDKGEVGLQSSTNQSGKKVYELHWTPGNSGDIFEQAFVDIVLKVDDRIVGYAVIELYATGPSNHSFSARNLKSAIFPKVNGEYQNITENLVKIIIEKIK